MGPSYLQNGEGGGFVKEVGGILGDSRFELDQNEIKSTGAPAR